MAKKNKNKRRGPQPTTVTPPLPKDRSAKKSKTHGQPTRETIESLVIAFVLAFLFRTFQAEAFVIPTGSMAPTLMGRHEDVWCDECGQRYKVSDSESQLKPEEVRAYMEEYHRRHIRKTPQEIVEDRSTVAGQCPNCRHTMLFQPVLADRKEEPVKPQPAYSGDRILVNKYLYSFTEPQRWDVIVFKYPGNAVENYIKRLVGLPGEDLRIEHGDVFASTDGDFHILRKPPSKILSMRQLVHDTDHDPAALREAGYPLRWSGEEWSGEQSVEGELVKQAYSVKPGGETAWLRYRHLPPGHEQWQAAETGNRTASGEPCTLEATPELVTDFNAYNTATKLQELKATRSLALPDKDKGIHWVGDLVLEAEVQIDSDSGTLLLELVESGCHFRCSLDVSTGEANMSAVLFEQASPSPGLQATAPTRIRGKGAHSLRFANVDDQLVLWVDGRVVKFDKPLTYNATELIADRNDLIPRSSDSDAGDLAPVAVGAEGLAATLTRLAVYRDIYYIADRSPSPNPGGVVSDYEVQTYNRELFVWSPDGLVSLDDLRSNPDKWDAYRSRRSQRFSLKSDDDEELLFVMGDNSAASSDARLWAHGNGVMGGIPGGHYLERKLLIGKAVCVYWPHSFDRVPGTPILFPFFPNFGDMRLVR